MNSVLGVTSVDEKDYHNDAVSMAGKEFYDLVSSHPLYTNVFPKGIFKNNRFYLGRNL